MIEVESGGGREVIHASCLQLRFLWSIDHWKHEICSTGTCAAVPLIWSVEGPHTLDDPSHVGGPTYQQLDVRRGPDGIARALLVGQSGPHHFSAAFLVEEKPDGVEIDVDLADRCRSKVEALSASYLIEASSARLRSGEGSAQLSWTHPETRLRFEADPPGRVEATEGSIGTIRFRAHAGVDPDARTHRLRYRWRWVGTPTPRSLA